MANRFIAGFDLQATADLSRLFGNLASAVIDGNGRNGGNAMFLSSRQFGTDLTLDAQATWIVGLAYKQSGGATSGAQIIGLFDTTTQHISILFNAAGLLEIRRGNIGTTLLATGTTAIVQDTWYYLEFKITISDTVGVVEAKINGVAETLTFVTGTSSTQDTRNGGNASANVIEFGQGASSGNDTWMDDIYVNDGSGGVDDTYWGDIRVVCKSVDGAGNHTDFTPSTGSNYQNVDDASPNGDTDYNESSAVNNIDSFTTAALGVTGTVKGLATRVYARKTDAGAGSIAPLWRISGTDYAGTGVALSTDYTYVTQLYRVSPATSSAWTTSEIDGAEVGYKRTA